MTGPASGVNRRGALQHLRVVRADGARKYKYEFMRAQWAASSIQVARR
jgi:hypothetical protein